MAEHRDAVAEHLGQSRVASASARHSRNMRSTSRRGGLLAVPVVVAVADGFARALRERLDERGIGVLP